MAALPLVLAKTGFDKVWIAHLDLALSSPEPRRDDARSAHRARMPVIAATRKELDRNAIRLSAALYLQRISGN